METIKSLFSTYPAREIAADLRVKHGTVVQWGNRNSIPAKYWDGLCKAAARRGVNVSPDWLLKTHAAKQDD